MGDMLDLSPFIPGGDSSTESVVFKELRSLYPELTREGLIQMMGKNRGRVFKYKLEYPNCANSYIAIPVNIDSLTYKKARVFCLLC